MQTIHLTVTIGGVSAGEIIFGLLILAALLGAAMAFISLLCEHDKNTPSELHARDRYQVADQIKQEQETSKSLQNG